MKTCPFCREEIHDEAIKCRYCGSSLLPPQPGPESAIPQTVGASVPSAESGQIVYVLDQGLIRFGKFVVGVLAIFVAVGIFLYGFDIKQTGKEVQDLAKAVESSADSVGKAKEQVASNQAESKQLLDSVQKQADAIHAAQENTQRIAAEVQANQQKVQAVAEAMRTLQSEASKSKGDIQQVMNAVMSARSESEDLLGKARTLEKQVEDEKEGTEKVAKEVEANRKTVQDLVEQSKTGATSITQMVTVLQARVMQTTGTQDSVSADNAGPALPGRTFYAPELARIYNLPADLTGSGQTIGLIELGGGYTESDLKTYFATLKMTKPTITSVSVDGGKNSPSRDWYGADGEVVENLEIAAAVAPGAHIVLYFTSNTSQGFLDGIEAAIADQTNRPSVILITWGGPEASFAPQAMQQMNEAFKKAAGLSITVVCGAGDSGVTDGVNDHRPHVDFPGSSPYVLTVGATAVRSSGNALITETVWNDKINGTGGGTSEVFPIPEWQSQVDVPTLGNGKIGRGVPDVSADGDPSSGYRVFLHGQWMVIGGTGGAASFWAGLIADLNQGRGRNVGYLNPVLYGKIGPAKLLRDITEGTNSSGDVQGCSAKPGWNTCAGWGSPDAAKLLSALRSY